MKYKLTTTEHTEPEIRYPVMAQGACSGVVVLFDGPTSGVIIFQGKHPDPVGTETDAWHSLLDPTAWSHHIELPPGTRLVKEWK